MARTWLCVVASFESSAEHPASAPTRPRAFRAHAWSCEWLEPRRRPSWRPLDAFSVPRYRPSECVHPRASLGAQDSCARDELLRCVERLPTLTNATRRGSIETSTATLRSHRVAAHRPRQCVRQEPTPLVATAPIHRTHNEATRRRKVISNRLCRSFVSYSMDFFVARISRVRSAKTSTLFQSLNDKDKATIASLTHAQTYYRSSLPFSKALSKSRQANNSFCSTLFLERSHQLCPDTDAQSTTPQALVPGAPVRPPPTFRIITARSACQGRDAKRRHGNLDSRDHPGSFNRRWRHGRVAGVRRCPKFSPNCGDVAAALPLRQRPLPSVLS